VFVRILPGKSGHTTILAIIVICAASYGIGFATPECYNDPVVKCIKASDRAQRVAAFDTQIRTPSRSQLSQNLIAFASAGCCNPSEACGNGAEGHSSAPSLYLNPQPLQSFGQANSAIKIADLEKYPKKDPNPTNSLIIQSRTPLYIRIESILC
jgi:hypothetical protein